MSLSTRAAGTKHVGRGRGTMVYRPGEGLLVIHHPHRGAYLYQDVPVEAYERLARSRILHASFARDSRRHYSLVVAS